MRTGSRRSIGTRMTVAGSLGSTICAWMPTRRTWDSVRTLPSFMVTLNSGSGLSPCPGTSTSSCVIGRKDGGNSSSAACVLKDDRTSHSTGPNISTTPSAR